MKILVYGAGVLGCNLARNLLRAGKDVTLLARGNWAAEIRRNGLRIKDKFSPCVSISRIPVVTELAPDAMYDVIFVVLRYTQLDSVLDALRANRTKNIVFVGNNVQARVLAAALPGKNVLFAFALSAGHREVDRVVSIDLNKILLSPSRPMPLRSAQNPHNCWVFETIYHSSCVLFDRPLHSKSCIKIVVVCRHIFL